MIKSEIKLAECLSILAPKMRLYCILTVNFIVAQFSPVQLVPSVTTTITATTTRSRPPAPTRTRQLRNQRQSAGPVDENRVNSSLRANVIQTLVSDPIMIQLQGIRNQISRLETNGRGRESVQNLQDLLTELQNIGSSLTGNSADGLNSYRTELFSLCVSKATTLLQQWTSSN